MKEHGPVLIVFALLVVLCLGLLGAGLLEEHMHAQPDASQYTLEQWRQETGYTGPVCLHPYILNNIPLCGNGAPYTSASVNAGEGYGLWYDCHAYNAPYACEELND